MNNTVNRVLDFVGAAAIGVVTTAAAGVAMPAWLVIAATVVTYAAGKASAPGVPFFPKKNTTPTDNP